MKKRVILLLTIIVAVTSVIGCSSKSETSKDVEVTTNVNAENKVSEHTEFSLNEAYSEEKMVTLDGTEVSVKENKNAFVDRSLGFGFVRPESWDSIDQNCLDAMVAGSAYYSGYLPASEVERFNEIDENMSEEEIFNVFDEIYSHEFKYFSIYRVYENDKDELISSELITTGEEKEIQSKYSETIFLGRIEKDSYYLSYNTEIPSGELDDVDKKVIQSLIDGIDDFKNNIIIFPAKNMSEVISNEGDLNTFTTLDIAGNEVTEEIFKDYDLTMINIWSTWCGPCVSEMPELAKLYNQLPDNVNMITICADATDSLDLAKDILKSADAKFITLRNNEEIEKRLLNHVVGFPTTVFVDSEGNLIGSPKIGIPDETGDVVEGYQKLIQNAL